MASGGTPLCFRVLQYSRKFLICSWGLSKAEPLKGLCCTIFIKAGLISQLFAWMAGITTSEFETCPLGIYKSLNFVWSPILPKDSSDSKSSTDASETAPLLFARKVLSGSGSKGAKGESSDDCINQLHEEFHVYSTHRHKQELYQGLVNQIP